MPEGRLGWGEGSAGSADASSVAVTSTGVASHPEVESTKSSAPAMTAQIVDTLGMASLHHDGALVHPHATGELQLAVVVDGHGDGYGLVQR